MADPFRSERLIYRAISTPEDDTFLQTVVQDPVAWQNSMVRIARPATKDDAANYAKELGKCLLGVIICLPESDAAAASVSDPPKSDEAEQPLRSKPIGIVHLTALDAGHAHHRHSEMGIDIIKPYQNRGYGSEAIRWAITWAFRTAGMHRIAVTCFEWNTGARRLYEKLGFKQEGRSREMFWFEGKWWDDIQYGLLEWEWQAAEKANLRKISIDV